MSFWSAFVQPDSSRELDRPSAPTGISVLDAALLCYRQFDGSSSPQNGAAIAAAGNRLLALMRSDKGWEEEAWCNLTKRIVRNASRSLHDRVANHIQQSQVPLEKLPASDELDTARLLRQAVNGLDASPVVSWVCKLPPSLDVNGNEAPPACKRPRDDDGPSLGGARAAVPPLKPTRVPALCFPPPANKAAAAPFRAPVPVVPQQDASRVAKPPVLVPPPPPAPVAPIIKSSLPFSSVPPATVATPSGNYGPPRVLGLRGMADSAGAPSALPIAQRSAALPQTSVPMEEAPPSGFVTAAQQLDTDIKRGRCPPGIASSLQTKPTIGLRRQPYAAPLHHHNNSSNTSAASESTGVGRVLSATVNPKQQQAKSSTGGENSEHDPSEYPAQLLLPDGTVPPILLPLDPKLVTQITYEILEKQCNVDWSDIAGLDFAKASVEEAIVWPLRRPDLFVGLRDPPRGLLLFGPPGTGKTMIARAIASRAECTFLNISSSSLMSKWVGDGEKMVRCMFAVAVVLQPSVIFIDEIDSLLSMRGEGEQDGVRRVKTEFLVQLDGVGTTASDRVLLIGATNRPEELDEAARRRMEKRLYIPLPEHQARKDLCHTLLSKGNFIHEIGENELEDIARMTEGYSGADLKSLCREAAMGPLRSARTILSDVAAADIRAVMSKDFKGAIKRIKPSVGQAELERYVNWNRQFGSFVEGDDDDE